MGSDLHFVHYESARKYGEASNRTVASSPKAAIPNGSEHEISDYQRLHYSYINDERLTAVNAGHGVSYQLAYDALGRCVKRTVNGGQTTVTTFFIYDGEKPILEYDGGAAHTLVGSNVYGKGI